MYRTPQERRPADDTMTHARESRILSQDTSHKVTRTPLSTHSWANIARLSLKDTAFTLGNYGDMLLRLGAVWQV